jgi:3-vinyl bacteriochlorophyllide hydratase
LAGPGEPTAGTVIARRRPRAPLYRAPLYTEAERRRRDATPWTLVQGILAPVQFLVFLVSLALVIHYLFTGTGFAAATVSIIVKTVVLYAIMVTGSIWEQRVFGQYLFARAFFWEDVFSMLVLALHTAYLVALACGMAATQLMFLALAAYASYLINATQFVLKLRAARLQAAEQAADWRPSQTATVGLGATIRSRPEDAGSHPHLFIVSGDATAAQVAP